MFMRETVIKEKELTFHYACTKGKAYHYWEYPSMSQKKKMHQENKYTLMIHFPENLTFLMSLSCLPFIYPIPPLSSFLNCISDESEKHSKQYMGIYWSKSQENGNKDFF
jgi:hypothetical protein